MTAYTKLGSYTIVPSADLTSLTSQANTARGSAVRNPATGAIGKVKGAIVIRATDVADPTTYSMVFATGDLPASVWRVVDGSATYTPV